MGTFSALLALYVENIDGLAQDCGNSLATTLELLR